jgi:hypothetical protein
MVISLFYCTLFKDSNQQNILQLFLYFFYLILWMKHISVVSSMLQIWGLITLKFNICGNSMYVGNSLLRKFQGTGKKIDIGGNLIYAGSI